jgi:hypothetical protein
MDILKSDQPVGRHAAAKRYEVPSWLPDKKSGKTIVGLFALAVTMSCFTVRTSVDLAAHGGKDPTPVIDGTDNLPQPAVPGDSIGTGTNSSADVIEVDGASRVGVCNIWQEQGLIGRRSVCPDTSTQINPDVQPLADLDFQTAGDSNPDVQAYITVDSADQSTTA